MNNSLTHAISILNTSHKHALEFGVFKGATLRQIKSSVLPDMKVFGFDSFCGLPEDWVLQDGRIIKAGAMNAGEIPGIDGVEIFDGWFKDTIPVYLEKAQPIALLHVDCDLYSSTKEVLWGLNDFILPGTIVVFDEWVYCHEKQFDDHEQKAFYEWVKAQDRECEFVKFMDTSVCGEERKIVRILK